MPAPVSNAAPLTREAFAPFGEVIEKAGSPSFPINAGNCQRHHALATTDIEGDGARAVISIFDARPYALPLALPLVERHPLGSQAFFPLTARRWLVVVFEDEDGRPVRPAAFLAGPNQGVNIARGVWHAVLTPLDAAADFLVVDRDGSGDNLEEFHFDTRPVVTLG